MEIDTLIPLADAIGASGFLVAAYIGVRNYRDTHAERVFWMMFTFTSLLGALWLSLVALEWMNVTPEVLDVLSTSLQAVVIGLFAVGTVGARSLVEDLKASNEQAKRRRGEAIDAHEEAEKQRAEIERMRDLMRNAERLAEVGSWEYNPGNDIFTWTDGTMEIFEVDAGKVADTDIALRFYHEDEREVLNQLLEECLTTGEPFQERLRIRTTEGSERWVEMYGERTEVGQGSYRIRGCLQDVTELQERQEQLAILDRVLRHNLRNDVNKIIGHAQLVKERTEGDLNEFIDDIVENANGLVEMANKQRTVTALLEEPRNRQDINLDKVIRPPVSRLRDRYQSASVEIERLDDITLRTIPELELVVDELGRNAIEHAEHDQPYVAVSGWEENGQVHISVADNGPGIPSHERRVITQEVDIDPLKHGSGMGLWMVKRIIHRAGGTLHFEPNEPRGSIVMVSFTS